MFKLLFLFGLMFMSGCSSLFVEQPKTPWQSLKEESHQCLSDLKRDTELKPIANKVTLENTYDRDTYFVLLNIKDLPTPAEKVAIKKWAAKLDVCYKLKAESYAYEPADVAKWFAVTDSEQQMLLAEFSRGNLSYGQFASKRLEIDTRYRGEITRAVSSGYKRSENMQQRNNKGLPNKPADSSSSCGWEGTQWVCRSL